MRAVQHFHQTIDRDNRRTVLILPDERDDFTPASIDLAARERRVPDDVRQQRQHWLAEQVLNWSGLPVVHVRPTIFLQNPLFSTLAAESIARLSC